MTKSLNQAFIKAYSKEERLAQKAAASPQPETSIEESYIVRFDTATMSVAAPHQPRTPSRGPKRQSVQPTESRLTAEPGPVPAPNLEKVQSPVSVRHAEVIFSTDVDAPSGQVAERPSVPQPTASANDSEQTLRESIASQMLQAGSWEFQSLVAGDASQTMHRVDPAPSEDNRASIPAPQRSTVTRQDAPAAQVVAQTAAVQTNIKASATGELAQPIGQQMTASGPSVQVEVGVAVSEQAIPDRQEAPATQHRNASPVQQHDATLASGTPKQRRIDSTEATRRDVEYSSPPAAQTSTAQPELQPLTEPALPQSSQRHEKDGEIFRLDRPTYEPASSIDDSGEVSAADDSHSVTSVDELAEISEAARAAAREAAAKKAAEAEQHLRASKKRIFNPVWEVDNFHWPDVCMDLLEQSGEQMDAVAENLSSACEEGLQVLAVTSPVGGEGRTTIACCLAMLAGNRGLNVAIIDADLEHPTLAFQTNLELEQDWRTAIEHQLPLEEVAVHSIEDQVTLIPLVAPVEHAEMSTDDDRIASMFQELSESFDLVIADMGPMNSPRSLVSTMGEHGIISAVVSVVNRRETPAEQIDACIRRVRQSGVVSIGLVENFVS